MRTTMHLNMKIIIMTKAYRINSKINKNIFTDDLSFV